MTPDTTHLTPITYAAALELYAANRRRPFSFVAAPYGVLKTITVLNGQVVASPPAPAYAHYEWLATNAKGAKR